MPSHDPEGLLTLIQSDWDAFARALSNTHPGDLAGCLMTLMPEIQSRPELVELLRQKLPASTKWIGPANMKTIEEWLPRTIIKERGRTVSQIAMALARKHDPTFPEFCGHFESPLATSKKRQIREGSELIQELVQWGRGWRWFSTYYDHGPGEIASYSEHTATAIHPDWTLIVSHVENTGSEDQLWSLFLPDLSSANELTSKTKPTKQGSAEIKNVLHDELIGTFAECIVLNGKLHRDHWLRLSRAGETIWQGKAATFGSNHDGEVLQTEKGVRFGLQLKGFSDIEAGDLLECFTIEMFGGEQPLP